MNEPELSGPRYWKSLDDLAETPAFRDWVEREFPAGASEMEGVNRRHFMKVMAASFGLAGLGMTGCRRPESRILPYSQQPENLIPGVPVYYTSSVPGTRDNIPVIVETHSGRPTKIEGNPSYVPYGGSTDIYSQASVLDLYDPDRATKSRERGTVVSPTRVLDRIAAINQRHTEDRGAGLVVLAEPSTSPTRAALVEEFKRTFPEALWAEYTPIDATASERANEMIFGQRLRTLPNFTNAKRILALDADFLSNVTDGGLGQARDWSKNRKIMDSKEASNMSRLYSVESAMTLTGSMADHRLRLSSSQIGAFAALIGAAVLRGTGADASAVSAFEAMGRTLSVDEKWIAECAADLIEHAGSSLVVAGDHLPAEVHAIVAAINEAIGARGQTVNYVEIPEAAAGMAEAVERLNQGGVQTLVMLGGNPAYDAPADIDWKAVQGRAAETIFLSYSHNETAAVGGLTVARSHYLESWSDGRTFDGTLVPVQPMIEPLFPTLSDLEFVARLVGASETDPYALVRATFESFGGSSFNRFLSDGLLPDSGYPVSNARLNGGQLITALQDSDLAAYQLDANNLEVRFAPSASARDGRFANNGWMMECPDPITKLTWDNAILISPRLAKDLQQSQGIRIFASDNLMNSGNAFLTAAKGTLQKNSATFKRGIEQAVIAELTINGRTLRAPIHVVPGMANYTVILPLGLGRTRAGRVGDGVGFSGYTVRESQGLSVALGGALKLTNETHALANTQEHWSMEGRAIIREGTAQYYEKNPNFANEMGVESHAPDNYRQHGKKSLQDKVTNQYRGGSAYEHPRFTDPAPNVPIWQGNEDKFPKIQQWGMAIDLNSCTGCSACVVACQSENNIPIVGKDQVARGREMHWMRIDRYFSAETYKANEIPEDVQVSFMGMLCQHCENAPCEVVCPVNATVHDEQGLNTMAYNRCVGTRYCANNCPYKVRRFNFFDWNKRKPGEFYKGPFGSVDEPELQKMQKNPDVTIRMRGVMEKCTYCTQRIESAKIDQKRVAGASDNIHVPDGRIKTACQQVCPTDAITFGDVSDAETEVSRMKASDRNYSVLGYLNVRPRTTYLARLRNPNPQMPDTYKQPFAYKNYKERYGSGSAANGSAAPAGQSAH